jgi:hypothetical protein
LFDCAILCSPPDTDGRKKNSMALLKISKTAVLVLFVAVASATGASAIVPPRDAASSAHGPAASGAPSCPVDFNPFDDAAPSSYALCVNQSRE